MSQLHIYSDSRPGAALQKSSNPKDITRLLGLAGVRFEQWQAGADIAAGDSQDKVLKAYDKDISRLVNEEGYQTVDVISIRADNPDKEALRQKFLSEHTHSEDEVRFFVEGKGLFSLHIGEKVYEVLCEKGDLISVPANTPHWFDMGPEPHLVAIRFFNNQEGWVAHYTGSEIADQFSRLNS